MSEFVSLGDTVYFGITVHNPSGSIGNLTNADTTPVWTSYVNASDTIKQQGNFTLRTGITGTYRANLVASAANGYASGNYVEIHASGLVNGVLGRAIVKTFVINDVFDCNVVQVSGNPVPLTDFHTPTANIENAVWNANINSHLTNETTGSGLNKLRNDVYFANIKFVKDSVVPRDEYNVSWFRNSQVLASGVVTNGAISVYKTGDGTALISNQKTDYFSLLHGALRYNEVTNLAVSGEAYFAVASGTIDLQTRVWSNLIGLDYL